MNKAEEAGLHNIVSDFFAHSEAFVSFDEQIDAIIRRHWNDERISTSETIDGLLASFDDTSLGENPVALSDYLEFIERAVIPNAINVSNPSYVGHMTSRIPNFHQSLSRLMVALNQNIVKIETSKVFTLIERQMLAVLHRRIYGQTSDFYKEHLENRESHLGIVVSGGTMANITSMWIARNRVLAATLGVSEKEKLLDESLASMLAYSGYSGLVVIGSASMHYSVNKLSSLLGIGYNNVIKIPLNDKGTVDIDEMEAAILACKERKQLILALIGIAGTTETGRIDDLDAIADLGTKYDIHFHVDGAWGGPVVLSERYNTLLKGVERADTISICGHKQLYLPQGVSFVIVKKPEYAMLIKSTARYQARQESFDLGKCSPEGSRPVMSFYLHAAMALLGNAGYSKLIDAGIDRARWFAGEIAIRDQFELIEEPMSNIVVYRYIPSELRWKVANGVLTKEDHFIINCVNEILQETQFKEGMTFISRTTLVTTKYDIPYPIIVLRAVIANPLSEEQHLLRILEDQIRIGDHVIENERYTFANVLAMLARQTSSIERQ